MGLTKDQLEEKFPGVVIIGDLNPDIPESQWLVACGLASLIATHDHKKSPSAKFVYCLQLEEKDIFKIGITSNIQNRVNSLQVGCHSKLKILRCIEIDNAKDVEKAILQDLSAYSTSGEWVECKKSIVLKAFKNRTHEELQRGNQFNRDDIEEMYGSRH